MKEFRVTLTQRAGELARLTQSLADNHVDLRSVSGITHGGKAVICLVAEDVAKMRAVLEAGRVPFEEEEIITELLEDEIGSVAEFTAKLAEADINIHSLYILARDHPLVEFGMTVDNPKKAKRALGK